MTDYKRLRELAQKATPGPRYIDYDSDSGEYGVDYGRWPYSLHGPKNITRNSDSPFYQEWSHDCSEFSEMSDEDAEFIAACDRETILELIEKAEIYDDLCDS